MPKPTTREVERILFDRMELGDRSARFELWHNQQMMIANSARKYAHNDPILQEELEVSALEEFEKALGTYSRNEDRHMTFSSWYFLYLGQRFASLTKTRKNLQTGGRWQERDDLPTDEEAYEALVESQTPFTTVDISQLTEIPESRSLNGRVDGGHFYHGQEPTELDSLPSFFNPQTRRVAVLLSQGFTPGEIKAMERLTEAQYRKKIDVIKKKLSSAA